MKQKLPIYFWKRIGGGDCNKNPHILKLGNRIQMARFTRKLFCLRRNRTQDILNKGLGKSKTQSGRAGNFVPALDGNRIPVIKIITKN